MVLFSNPQNNEIFCCLVAKNIELDESNEKMSFPGKTELLDILAFCNDSVWDYKRGFTVRNLRMFLHSLIKRTYCSVVFHNS